MSRRWHRSDVRGGGCTASVPLSLIAACWSGVVMVCCLLLLLLLVLDGLPSCFGDIDDEDDEEADDDDDDDLQAIRYFLRQ